MLEKYFKKTSIEKIGNFYIKLIKIEGKWHKKQVNPQKNLLSKNLKR